MRRLVVRHLVAGASTLLIFPALCFAQFGAIAGVIKDDSGAVLPGVTVEASSPALIEKTRTAVSDSAGQYRVEQLRPGVYTVTFTLQGFTVIRREGIEISAGFTAPVNPSLRVSAITETITVSGEAPVVDVQSSSERKQLSKEALDALPSARSFATLGTTIPGVTANQRDVGGTQGERGNVLSAHGGSGFDMTVQLDGVALGNMSPFAGSAWSNFSLNDAAAQEMVFETGAVSVEAATGGVRVNVVPREGGNRFSGSAFGNFSKRSMSRSNYTPELQARGLRAPAGFDSLVDESVGIGGPIRRDRLWFFGAHRYRSNVLKGSNQFFSIDPLAYTYNPDLTRPLNAGGFDMDNQVRGLDPDKEGAIIWEHRIGKGTVTGGIEWGGAADEQVVYYANNDGFLGPKEAGGLAAIRVATGVRLWLTKPPACPDAAPGGARRCSPGQPAAVTVIPGVVFSGSLDGIMRAYDTQDGRIIWEFNTAQSFPTINGVEGKGGSINGRGPVIAGGILYVNSGYGSIGGVAGHLLLAFAADWSQPKMPVVAR